MVGKKGIMWCCSGIQTRVLVGSQAFSEPILRPDGEFPERDA